MLNTIYTLPDVEFVGGETNEFLFPVYKDENKSVPLDLSGCTASFDVINIINKSGTPIVSKAMLTKQADPSDDASPYNILTVILSSSDTVNLCGKYVYQITIVDNKGNTALKQGLLQIHGNINRNLLRDTGK